MRKSKGNFGGQILLSKIKLFKDLYLSYSFKIVYSKMLGTGEIGWTVLVEDLNSAPSTHVGWLTTTWNSRGSNTLFHAPKASASHGHKP